MKKKLSIYIVIFLIFSSGALWALPLHISLWEAEIISLTSSAITSFASIIVAYLTHNGKPKSNGE